MKKNDKLAPRFLMKIQVRTGLGVIPSFKSDEISSEDLEALMDYIPKLRRHDAQKAKGG